MTALKLKINKQVFGRFKRKARALPEKQALETGEAEKFHMDQNTVARSVYDWIEAAVFSLVCVVLVFTFLVRIVGVKGPSMENTLFENDRLLLTSLFYTPERGDIVVINRYVEDPLIKRVIAVAGDTLEIDPVAQQVILNGEVQDESAYTDFSTPPIDMIGEIYVPEGYVFVMGDHRTDSHDSRSADIGLVRVKDIVGKAVFRIWPFQDVGFL